jgi:hypothetical protein
MDDEACNYWFIFSASHILLIKIVEENWESSQNFWFVMLIFAVHFTVSCQ